MYDRYEAALQAIIDQRITDLVAVMRSGSILTLEDLRYISGQLRVLNDIPDVLSEVRQKLNPSTRERKGDL